MDRKTKLRLIYRWTHSDFKSRIDGKPYLMVFRNGSCLVPLDALTAEEIESKLPYALKKENERTAAVAKLERSVS